MFLRDVKHFWLDLGEGGQSSRADVVNDVVYYI
jgi:hypothetical protein